MHFDEANINPIWIKIYLCVWGGGGLALQIAVPSLVVGLSVRLGKNEKWKLFYYLTYFYYYLWALLYFLTLFIDLTILF